MDELDKEHAFYSRDYGRKEFEDDLRKRGIIGDHKKLIEFIELIKQYKKFSFADFLKNHSEYSENIRQNLILAGEYDLLEKYDIEKHMLKVN